VASVPTYVRPNPVYRVVYKTTILLVVLIPLLATALALRLLWQRVVHTSDLMLLAAMYGLVALGVTVGYHRMLTHRSFRAQPVVKLLLLILGSMAFEGPAIQWAATHTKHHARADREGDPHSPVDGFFHAHLGWIFRDGDADPRVYCRHLLNDRIVRFVSKTFLLWAIVSLAIPFGVGWLVGGWPLALTGLLWGGLVRMFLTHHVTWSVNSVCHTFGRREFETTDQSRNEWIVGLLAFGEGWHNNHHAFPRSAFHGLHWWQFDVSSYLIWALERLGLARDVYRVSAPVLMQRAGKTAICSSVPLETLKPAGLEEA
jgi:stearoyl-CoA desaturase (Delta-9 desaturase)